VRAVWAGGGAFYEDCSCLGSGQFEGHPDAQPGKEDGEGAAIDIQGMVQDDEMPFQPFEQEKEQGQGCPIDNSTFVAFDFRNYWFEWRM
jgi:hypothetical protein